MDQRERGCEVNSMDVSMEARHDRDIDDVAGGLQDMVELARDLLRRPANSTMPDDIKALLIGDMRASNLLLSDGQASLTRYSEALKGEVEE